MRHATIDSPETSAAPPGSVGVPWVEALRRTARLVKSLVGGGAAMRPSRRPQRARLRGGGGRGAAALSESGDTGKRIGDQVNAFGTQTHEALTQAAEHTAHDGEVIQASAQTITQVVEQVDGAVSQLNARAVELNARGAAVRVQVGQLMVAFQFQDPMHQIMDQASASIHSAVGRLQQSRASGTPPDA